MPSSLTIRPITPADSGTWEQLRDLLWPDPAGHAAEIAAFFAGTLNEPQTVFFAENESSVVAFAELSIRTDVPGLEGKTTCYVEGLYVLPEVRHQGIARQFLLFSREWARQQGCEAFASDRAERIVIDHAYQPPR